jgi:sirohydrochlorin cobaltochelatase
MKGILLFGHGARNPDWAAPFFRIRDEIRTRDPATPVEMGFLELMRPSFDEAVDALAAAGVKQIVVVPIFMAAGSHIKKDLPLMAGNAMDRHPTLSIELAPPVGEAAPVLAAMADYALTVESQSG